MAVSLHRAMRRYQNTGNSNIVTRGRPKGAITDSYAMTDREIGERLGLARTSVNSIVRRAMKKLQANPDLMREVRDTLAWTDRQRQTGGV